MNKSVEVRSWRNHKRTSNVGFSNIREAIRWAIQEENDERRSHSSIWVDGKEVIDVEKLRAIGSRLWLVKHESDGRKWMEAHQEVFGGKA